MSKNQKSESTKSQKSESETTVESTKEEFVEITLLRNPIQTIYHLVHIILGEIVNVASFLKRNYLIPFVIILYLILTLVQEGPHREYIDQANKIGYFCLYWVLLGVASSIGLARISGKTLEEIEELNNIASHYDEMPFIEKAKYVICSRLKTHGFIIVLLAASIPNPLFDLAGITCGHFLVPFSTFFGATFIGKAVFKVTLQAVFVIVTFSKHHVENILSFLETNLPFLHGSLSKALEKQKHLLWHSDHNEDSGDKPLIATIWEGVITVMIVYFLISIINSVVSSKRRREFEEKANKEK